MLKRIPESVQELGTSCVPWVQGQGPWIGSEQGCASLNVHFLSSSKLFRHPSISIFVHLASGALVHFQMSQHWSKPGQLYSDSTVFAWFDHAE